MNKVWVWGLKEEAKNGYRAIVACTALAVAAVGLPYTLAKDTLEYLHKTLEEPVCTKEIKSGLRNT